MNEFYVNRREPDGRITSHEIGVGHLAWLLQWHAERDHDIRPDTGDHLRISLPDGATLIVVDRIRQLGGTR